MVKYSVEADDKTAAKAKGSHVRVHFKNSVEVAAAIRGMSLERAKTYLAHVLNHEEAIPFNRFKGGRGRHAQAKNLKVPGSLVGWPVAAVKAIQSLLLNAEANAESKGLETETLFVNHISSKMAPKGRRRTYRAHGRINAYMSNPAHIEIILGAKPAQVPKAEGAPAPRLFKRKLAAKGVKVPVGGGADTA